MKTLRAISALTLALSLSACAHAGPTDAELNQAFSNYGWTRVGLFEGAKDKVHAHDCTVDAHDSAVYVCQVTVDGFKGAKASISFRKNSDGSWTVAF